MPLHRVTRCLQLPAGGFPEHRGHHRILSSVREKNRGRLVGGIALGEAAYRQLQAAGYTVEWHTYGMPHAVCPQEVADIGAWLRRVLP